MDDILRCPVVACIGWICEVEQEPDPKFWGCGECGTAWFQWEALDRTIDDVISRLTYRRNVYVGTDSRWRGVDPDAEPDNYEALVEEETGQQTSYLGGFHT